MTILDTLLLWLAAEIISGIFTFRFYKRAGYSMWSAFVPFYNKYILTRIIARPAWWTILFYIPVVNNVMAVVAIYELLHVFNYRKLYHTFLAIITFGLYLAYINFSDDLNYVGRDEKNIRKHVSELAASLIFAVVAATIIRTFTFEAFTIPTPSMEKSLMVGDFLFVSKIEYGSRLPMTPLSIPLVHNKIPGTNTPSFLDWVQLPYLRLPRISEVKKLDPVVFNYPMESDLPIDKREHYVKRCIATPGDTLEIVDGQVYINGEVQEWPERASPQFSYYVQTNGVDFNRKTLKEKFDINYLSPEDQQRTGDYGAVFKINSNNTEYLVTIPSLYLEEFKAQPNVTKVIRINSQKSMADYPPGTPRVLMSYYQNQIGPSSEIFPNPVHGDSLEFPWTRDNYGPLYIPKAGDEVKLNRENYFKFHRIIQVYENNTLEVRDGKFYVNGQEAETYTFKQDYYWMMGDNRHNSLDSRYWGYVPEDHIVGKPVFIWMSYDKYADNFLDRFRGKRIFTTVSGEGKRVSYFWPFVILVALLYGISYFRRRRRVKAENGG